MIPINLLKALRVSMEEQRARQEDEARKVAEQSAEEAGVKPAAEGMLTDLWLEEEISVLGDLKA